MKTSSEGRHHQPKTWLLWWLDANPVSTLSHLDMLSSGQTTCLMRLNITCRSSDFGGSRGTAGAA